MEGWAYQQTVMAEMTNTCPGRRSRLRAGAFEIAELIEDQAELDGRLVFVVVGAGPTGVEMAGQITELAHSTLRCDFRRIDPTKARVILLDAAPVVLGKFGDRLSQKARARLEKIGVEVQLNMKVVGVGQTGLDVTDLDGNYRRITTGPRRGWRAWPRPAGLGVGEADRRGAGWGGRVMVEPGTTLPGHPEIFVIGDMMSLDNLPCVAQVAMQQGRCAARTIEHRLVGKPGLPPFRYRDKGSMATVSRFHAVASIGSRIRLAGFLAWLMWLAVHLVYRIGFKNRVATLLQWTVTSSAAVAPNVSSPNNRSSSGWRSPGTSDQPRTANDDKGNVLSSVEHQR